MIQELYVHNFRCLENFKLSLKGKSSSLLIGKNGAGKTTIASALEIFQKIGRGTNRVGQLVGVSDFTRNNITIPMRFQLEILIDEKIYKYALAFEYPPNFSELRILEEEISVDEQLIYSRKPDKVTLYKNKEASFPIDWHLVALPLIQTHQGDSLQILQSWLANMIILNPIPSVIQGTSITEQDFLAGELSLRPERDGSNFGEWWTALLTAYPAAYSIVDSYMRDVMPDFDSLQNQSLSRDIKRVVRNITVQFKKERANFSVNFNQLSDGEKCFFICALVIATNKHSSSSFCFWDEPDNYLAISEVGHFVTELRRTFKTNGQILITSHNAQAIERFSDENTFVLDRKSHLEPTLCKLLEEIPRTDDLISALILGDIVL